MFLALGKPTTFTVSLSILLEYVHTTNHHRFGVPNGGGIFTMCPTLFCPTDHFKHDNKAVVAVDYLLLVYSYRANSLACLCAWVYHVVGGVAVGAWSAC